MSRYGIDYYGIGQYGPATIVEYDASPFTALPSGYGVITLEWATPAGDWSPIRLVRNPYGFPLDPDDGDTLQETTKASDTQLFIDQNLQQGRTYYYSLFIFETSNQVWLRAGNTYGISVKNFGTCDDMYNYLPQIYRQVSQYNNAFSSKENEDLRSFLCLFAFEYDLEKTYAYNLMNSYDTSFVDGRYIPQLMKQFGLSFEPEIGLKQSRVLLRNAMRNYKTKGSKDGFATYLKSFTGYDVTITQGKNLILDFNDSSFEQNIGSWTASAATIERVATGTAGITAYSEPNAPVSYPNKTAGLLKATVTTAGTIELLCGTSNYVTKGIPVTAGQSYSYSVYAQAGTIARNMYLTIAWYNCRGQQISVVTGNPVSVTTGSWQRIQINAATAPTNAMFALIGIYVTGTALNNVFYFDAVQFEQAASATFFEEARVVKATFKSSRKNELLNPNFQTNTQWTATNGTLVLASSIASTPTKYQEALVLNPTTVAINTRVNSENLTIAAPKPDYFTFSSYARFKNQGANPDSSDLITVRLRWYDSSNALIRTDSGTPVLGTTSDWVRPSVTAYAPSNTSYCVASIEWVPSSTQISLIVDEALFERSAFVNQYFDGTVGVATVGNIFWEGSSNASKSHLYINKAVVEGRLLSDIDNYLTNGTQYQLLFAQP